MLHWEHSAILLTFINVPFVIKIFVLSILSGRFTQVYLYSVLNKCNIVQAGGKILTPITYMAWRLWDKCTKAFVQSGPGVTYSKD